MIYFHFIKLTMAVVWRMDYNGARLEAGRRPPLRILQSRQEMMVAWAREWAVEPKRSR